MPALSIRFFRGSAERMALAALIAVFLALALLNVYGGSRLLNRIFSEGIEALGRDSMVLAANDLVLLESELASPSKALTALHAKISMIHPGTLLVLVDESGSLHSHSGTCTKKQLSYRPEVLRALSTRLYSEVATRLPAPCMEDLRLIAAVPVALSTGTFYLLRFAPLSDIFQLPAALSKFLWLFLFPCAFFGLILLTLSNIYRGLKSQLQSLLITVRDFLAGQHHLRCQTGFFSDFDGVAYSFNQMAAEYESGFKDLAEEQEKRRRITASLIHDIRTPLTSIGGVASYLPSQNVDAERQEAFQGALLKNIAAMQRLTDGLAALSDVSSRTNEIRFNRVDLIMVAKRTLSEILPEAERRGIRTEMLSEAEELIIEGDDELLGRALSNLLSNALRFTPRGGWIRLEAGYVDSAPAFTVSDSGPGIKLEDQEKIFEEFFRGTVQPDASGFGIGLAFVRRVGELHRGSIRYLRRSDCGACFCLSLHSRSSESLGVKTAYNAPVYAAAAAPHSAKADLGAADRYSLSGTALCLLLLVWFSSVRYIELPCIILCAAILAILFELIRPSRRALNCFLLFMLLGTLFVARYEDTGAAAVIEGFMVSSTLVPFAMSYHPLLGVIPLTAFPTLGYLTAKREDNLLLGMIVSMLLSFGAIPFDRLPRFRKIAFRTSGLATLLSCAGLACQMAAIYFIAAKLAPGVSVETQKSRLQTIGSWLESGGCQNPLESCLLRFAELDPISDYALVDVKGPLLWQSDEDDSIAGRETATARFHIFEAEKAVRPLEIWMASPGDSGLHFLSIASGNPILYYTGWATLILILAFYFPAYLVTARMRRELKQLVEGVERYRENRFDQPIQLQSQGLLGELSRSLDRIGEEIPKIRRQLAAENEKRATLVGRLHKVLEQGLGRIRRYIGADGLFAAPHLVIEECQHLHRLLHRILTVFRAAGEAAPQKQEILPLSELLIDLNEWKARSSLKTPLHLDLPEDEIFVQANPAELIECLQIAIREFAKVASRHEEIRISLEQQTEGVELRIGLSQGEKTPARPESASEHEEHEDLGEIFPVLGFHTEFAAQGDVAAVKLSLKHAGE